MIDDFNLVLLSGGFYECTAAWSKAATLVDQCYKVYFPVSGKAYLEMGSECYTLKANRIYFISGFRLTRQLCPEQLNVYWMHFVPESLYLRYLLDQLPPVCSWSRQRAGWPAGSYQEICQIFENPASGQSKPRPDSKPSVDCRIQGLLMGLIARLLESLDQERVRAFQPEYYRLKAAFDFMQTHFRDNPSLKEIAGKVGLAPNYFHRRFTKLFGATPFNYMLAQRMNRARHLLSSTAFPVKEVALQVGYEDAAYFTRAFTAQLAISPSDYRAKHR